MKVNEGRMRRERARRRAVVAKKGARSDRVNARGVGGCGFALSGVSDAQQDEESCKYCRGPCQTGQESERVEQVHSSHRDGLPAFASSWRCVDTGRYSDTRRCNFIQAIG